MNSSQHLLYTAPSGRSDRLIDIDILRGFALFGVIVVNIFNFVISHAYYKAYFVGLYTDVWNHAVYHIINFLFTGKFYPIFSFLFGIGFYYQFSKLQRNGTNTRSFFTRRLLFLLFLGILHFLFVWEEDILFFYALFGFSLIFLADRQKETILRIAILAYIFFICVEVMIANHMVQMEYNPFNSLDDGKLFYTTASYWQILQVRVVTYIGKSFTLGGFIDHFDRLAFMLFGFYSAKKGFITDVTARRRYWIARLIVALIIAIPIHLVFWYAGFESSNSIFMVSFLRIIDNLFILVQAFTYVVGFLLLLNINSLRERFKVLASPGRMTLTNYLLHTITFSFIFYSYGLGLYARLSPLQLFAIASLLFVFFLLFSDLWFKYFNFGPLEWAWRSFTYRMELPLRKSPKHTPSFRTWESTPSVTENLNSAVEKDL